MDNLDACRRCGGTGAEPGLIPLPGLEPAKLRSVRRDGQIVWQFRCPECRQWGDIDNDQLHGRVSIDHTDQQCGFHETHDLAKIAGAGALEARPNTASGRPRLDIDPEALLSAWETERDGRRALRDAMALDSNRRYQEGFADGIDHAIHALKVAGIVSTATATKRPTEG